MYLKSLLTGGGRLVLLLLVSLNLFPGGGPFSPDCMNPVSEFDCVYGCWSYDSCSLCCAALYPRDDQKEERDKFENRC